MLSVINEHYYMYCIYNLLYEGNLIVIRQVISVKMLFFYAPPKDGVYSFHQSACNTHQEASKTPYSIYYICLVSIKFLIVVSTSVCPFVRLRYDWGRHSAGRRKLNTALMFTKSVISSCPKVNFENEPNQSTDTLTVQHKLRIPLLFRVFANYS